MKHEKNLEWQATLDAIETTHNLTARDICNILKTSRTWVNWYVTSNPKMQESKINLPNGRGANTNGKKQVNWVYLAAKALGKEGELTASNWYCIEDFENLIRNSVFSVTRQTIQIPVEIFISDHEKFKDEYNKLQKEIENTATDCAISDRDRFQRIGKMVFQQENLWREYVSEEKSLIVSAGDCSNKGRSKIERTPCEIGDIIRHLNNLVAPHELKGYGGTDEQVFRKFFKEGYIRVELHFEGQISDAEGEPDEQGRKPRRNVAGEKIYYLKDPNPIKHKYIEQYVTFSYQEWLKYKIVFKDELQQEQVPF